MKQETFKVFEKIFGKGEVKYYQKEIQKALECNGKYKNSHGFIHSGIVLYINSSGEDFISKASIYSILEAFGKGKDSVDMSNVLIPASPLEVLRLAKRFIDNFNTGGGYKW